MDDRQEQERLWFGEDTGPAGSRSNAKRKVGVALICLVCLAAVAVPVALTLSSGSGRPVLPQAVPHPTATHLPQGQAQRQVLAALSATTGSGSFNVTYEFDAATPPTVSTTTSVMAPR